MIPKIFVEQWRYKTNLQTDEQAEQDLVISRLLICLYNNQLIADHFAFRGGTALNKLFTPLPVRYSEDIDLIQVTPQPIGEFIDRIREIVSNQKWLNLIERPKGSQTERNFRLKLRYQSLVGHTAQIKIEINTSEHFKKMPLIKVPLKMDIGWAKEYGLITTYELVELMATKLRALYQRNKGRDLFDLWYFINHYTIDIDQLVAIFNAYCASCGYSISKTSFQKKLKRQIVDKTFTSDMNALFPLSATENWDILVAYDWLLNHVIEKLP